MNHGKKIIMKFLQTKLLVASVMLSATVFAQSKKSAPPPPPVPGIAQNAPLPPPLPLFPPTIKESLPEAPPPPPPFPTISMAPTPVPPPPPPVKS